MDKLKGILFAALSAATFGLIPLYANQAILDGVNNETILVTGSREFYTLSIYCFEEPICG